MTSARPPIVPAVLAPRPAEARWSSAEEALDWMLSEGARGSFVAPAVALVRSELAFRTDALGRAQRVLDEERRGNPEWRSRVAVHAAAQAVVSAWASPQLASQVQSNRVEAERELEWRLGVLREALEKEPQP